MSDTRVLMIETPLFSHFVKNVARRAYFGMDIIEGADRTQDEKELVRAHQPDVLIVDLRGQLISTFEIIKQISDEYPKMLIIGRTKNPEIEFILEAVSAGVVGFINDQTSCEELVRAIHTIRQGYPYYPQNVVDQVIHNLQTQHRSIHAH